MPFDTAMNREISNKIRKMLELQIKHTAYTYDVAEGIVATDGRELVNEDNIIPKREKLMDLSENLPEPEKELTGGALGSIGGYGRATIRDLGVGKVLNGVSGRGKPKSNNYKSFEEMTLKSLKKIAKIYNNLVNIDNVDNLTKEELITELEKHLYFSGKNLKTKVETMELTKKDKEEIKKILQEENMNVKEKEQTIKDRILQGIPKVIPEVKKFLDLFDNSYLELKNTNDADNELISELNSILRNFFTKSGVSKKKIPKLDGDLKYIQRYIDGEMNIGKLSNPNQIETENEELEFKDIPQVGVKVYQKVPVKGRVKVGKKLNVKNVKVKEKPASKAVMDMLRMATEEKIPAGISKFRTLPKRKATPKTAKMSSTFVEPEQEEELYINPFIGQGKRKTKKTNETKSLKLKRMVVGGKKPRGRPSKMKGGADLAKPYNMVNEKGLTGNGNKLDRKIGGNLKVTQQMQGSTLSGMGKKKARSDIVKDVMKKRGCSMIEASKIVKNEGLY